jgi:ankyrin repeat protein
MEHPVNIIVSKESGGHHETVNLLIDKGAHVNAQGSRYDNAAQAASPRGHQDIVKSFKLHISLVFC